MLDMQPDAINDVLVTTRGLTPSTNRRAFTSGLAASIVLGSSGFGAPIRSGPATAYRNGLWFDGRSFRHGDRYSQGGRLTLARPRSVAREVDLAQGFVVPPFAEAHNHNLAWDDEQQFAKVRDSYLRDGVFYVKNPTNLPRTRAPLAGRINIPTSVDGVFSNGCLTSSGGHPAEIVKRNIERGGMTAADGDGAFYYAIDSIEDLDRKWPALLSTRPDFVKVVLVHSEDHQARRSADRFFGRRGLDPSLLRPIVLRANAAGLTVSAHVETAADFRAAVAAGVREIAHLPGFGPEPDSKAAIYALTEADARSARSAGVHVVTTISDAADSIFGKEGNSIKDYADIYQVIVSNLRLLRGHGVPLAIGSDEFRETSLPEVMKLRKFRVFDDLTLLNLWCSTSRVAIFPKRPVGRLAPGHDASFLVLADDPTRDLDHVRSIRLRVKEGVLLSV